MKCSASVIARRGSYSSHDLVRKGGSDEGEEKPINRAVVMLDMEGCNFLMMINAHTSKRMLIRYLALWDTCEKTTNFLSHVLLGPLPWGKPK